VTSCLQCVQLVVSQEKEIVSRMKRPLFSLGGFHLYHSGLMLLYKRRRTLLKSQFGLSLGIPKIDPRLFIADVITTRRVSETAVG
jgi:hypothetical protein